MISEVEWINKKSADSAFDGPKSGPVFMLKVFHSLLLTQKCFIKFLQGEKKVMVMVAN